jgi:hypothetical protein
MTDWEFFSLPHFLFLNFGFFYVKAWLSFYIKKSIMHAFYLFGYILKYRMCIVLLAKRGF